MTATGPASPHYVEDAVDIIRKVHRTQGAGHVLAFFTGQDEIERAGRLLSETVAQEKVDRRAMGIEEEEGAGNGVSELVIVPLFGALSAEAQANAFKPARTGVRKLGTFIISQRRRRGLLRWYGARGAGGGGGGLAIALKSCRKPKLSSSR